MDEAVEQVVKGLWGVLRFVLWDLVIQVVVFNTGRVVLLIGSLGRFPRRHHLPRYETTVIGVGIATICLAWVGVAAFNQLS